MHYRLYLINDQNHVVRGKDCLEPDDQTAILRASHLAPESTVEVWQGARLVARLDKAAACIAA